MLRTITDLKKCSVVATDGDIGKITDVYFEDEGWTVRCLVVDTGTWLSGRKVLLSPLSFQERKGEPGRLFVTLTKAQVRESPEFDTEKPVSRQREISYARHYGYPSYWDGPYRWGPTPFPGLPGAWPGVNAVPAPNAVEREIEAMVAQERESADPHLRSASEIVGYSIEAADGSIGHVEEVLIDNREWAIRYLVIDTRNWWPGKKVLISPAWTERVSYDESTVHISMRREAVQSAPEYEQDLLDREYESRLHQHYGKPGYWSQRPESWKLFPAEPSAKGRRKAEEPRSG